ncbi:hypothetical protein [Piscinibacter sp.]|uniref:hypothetical protein n=1 Tax=Piscinibacter sp. TaxID=1903157 RepID=UPI0039E5F813
MDFSVFVVRVASKRSVNGAEESPGAARVDGMQLGLQLLSIETLLDVSYAIASPTPTELAVAIDSGAVGKHVAQRY